MIARRRLLLGLGAGAFAAPGIVPAQGKPRRIGILNAVKKQAYVDAGWQKLFLTGMRELGYVERRDFVLEERFADDDAARLPALVADLVRSGVDVIVTPGTQITRAAQQGTSTIPIVVLLDADPVANGFADSLARPGRNLTGFSTQFEETTIKSVELMGAIVPKFARIGTLTNPSNAIMHKRMVGSMAQYGQKVGLQVVAQEASGPAEIDGAIAALVRERVQAFIVLPDSIFATHLGQIARAALTHKLPATASRPEFPAAGGLFSYGIDATDNWRRGAKFIDRIFKGAKAGDLPFEQPTTFDFVVNLKTAKALGLKVSQSVLVQATRVIE